MKYMWNNYRKQTLAMIARIGKVTPVRQQAGLKQGAHRHRVVDPFLVELLHEKSREMLGFATRAATSGRDMTDFWVGGTFVVSRLVDRCHHCARGLSGIAKTASQILQLLPDARRHIRGGYSQRIAVDRNFVLKMRNLKAELPAIASPVTDMAVLARFVLVSRAND